MSNKKLLILGLAACLVGIIAALIIENQTTLDEPILLKVYIEEPLNINDLNIAGKSIKFLYINGVNHEYLIRSGKFLHDDFPVDGWSTGSSSTNVNLFRYNLEYAQMSWNFNLSNYDKDIEFSQLKLLYEDPENDHFSFDDDSNYKTKDIGRVIYYQVNNPDIIVSETGMGYSGLLNELSIGAQDGNGNYYYFDEGSYYFNEDVILTELESKLIEEFKDNIEIIIDDIDYKDIDGHKIEANKRFPVKIRLETPPDFFFSEFKLNPKLKYKDMNGNNYESSQLGLYVKNDFAIGDVVKKLRDK